METVCEPSIKELTEFVTRLLVKDPDLAVEIAFIIGYTIPNFLKKYLNYALPYAVIYDQDEDTLLGIANAFDTSIVDLCENEACHVILSLLFEQNAQIKSAAVKRLDNIFQHKNTVKQLITNNNTKLMTILAMSLGHPTSSEMYRNALIEIKNTVQGEKYDLSDSISSLFMAISEKISSYITEKRNHTLKIQYPYALESLKVIMSLLKLNLDNYNLHVSIGFFKRVNRIKCISNLSIYS